MNKILFRLLCLVCLSTNFSVFAQETPDPQDPKKQPLDIPTEAKETPKKQDPALADKKTDIAASVAGGTPAGKTPEASPEIKLVNRFQDIPVNLFLGTPIIVFPIYTLTEPGGASFPIALSYNATGMKGHDVASWCGINWIFNQPQITRIVRGLPDEGKFTLNNDYSNTARKGFYKFGLKADNDTENDGQPDLFFLNINGQSYKFSFDANKKAHFYPEADIDVQVTWTARVGDDLTTLTNVGYFSNWIITMPDGTKYYFDGLSAYESSFEQEAQAAKDINNFNSGRYLNAEEVVSAFYLTKIETAFGHQTIFEYRNTAYSYSRIAEQEATTINCTFTGIEKKINRVFVISSTLYKISNGTHVVEFNKGGWSQGTDLYGRPYWYLNTTYPARKDIDFYAQDTRDSSNARALHKITVYAKDDPTKLYEWKFKYDYSTGSDQSTTPLGYSYSTIGRTHQKRFKLRSIEEPDGNKYTFKYFDDGFFLLPSRLTQGIDHWGYFNGVLGANLMIGQDAFRNCANGQYADRTARITWSQYGTLTGISHSTGGSTLLDYENNTARNYASIIGGSRIAKITFVDSVSMLKTIKKYDYKQTNGQSSGFLCLKPVYHFDDKINYQGAPNQFWYSGLYQQLLSESGRPAVGYSRVRETTVSSDETDTLGYSVSEFLQPLQEINLVETVTYNCVTQYPPAVPFPITTCDTSRYLRPWKWSPYHENTVGVPSRMAVYGKANQILSESKSVYTEQQLQGTSVPYQENYHSFRLVGQNYNFERSYYEFYNTYRLTSDTTKIYSQDGTNPLVSYSSQEFPTGGKHNQVIKASSTDSYGNTIEQTTKYAPDLATTAILPPPPANSDGYGVIQLKVKHIYTAPIEQIIRKKSYFGSSGDFIMGANYFSYYNFDSVGHKGGMLRATFSAENLPRKVFNEVSFNSGTYVLVKDSGYDLKTTMDSYTNIGLPIQISTRFATKSKVNYDATYPTLPISQISNLGLASEQTTSTEYAKILYGVSKQTGVNGLSVTNEYYADGKLKQQTDKDGNVLKHIQYVYRGQADADPLLTTDIEYNRIITRIPRIATTTPLTLTHMDCAISVVYMDGSGRVVEQIGYRASPNEKDMVSGVTEYDKFSRPIKSWLAVESTQTTSGLLDTATVKSIARAFYKDTKPHTEILEYEASPLSRVFKSYGAGKVWRDSLKYMQNRYETATGIRRFRLFYDNNYILQGTYDTYELSKMTSIDERGNSVIEYKDRLGNTVQRDIQVGVNTYLSTVYIYDEANRLRYILMPKAVSALASDGIGEMETWSAFNENVYAYHYDGRGRIYESHKPGIGWERTIFNRLNQPVLSQDDDELAKNNMWNYAQMDGQGRTVKMGQMQLPEGYTRAYLQEIFDNFTVNNQFEQRSAAGTLGYDNNSFPNILRVFVTETSLKNVSYFDDYNWRTNNPYSGQITDYDFKLNPYNSPAYSTTNAKGLMTGSLHKIDNFGDFWFPSIGYFDDKNRPIQSIGYQDLYARNQSDTKYNFVGESLINQNIYRKNGDLDRVITKENTLDHVGRTKDFYYTLREGTVDKVPRLKMLSLFYDNIGRLQTKIIEPKNNVVSSLFSGNWTTASIWTNNTIPSLTTPAVINQGHTITIPANTTVQAGTLYDAGTLKFLSNSRLQMGLLAPVRGAGLQTIEYAYNIRSQMRGVNLDALENPQVSQNKLFSYKLDYHEDGRYFDGSISKQTWKSSIDNQTRTFRFSYDRANRLTSAISGASEDNFSIPRVSYDVNGNITFLSRMAKVPFNGNFLTTKIDSLNYQYFNDGNKLKSVTDNAIRATLGGFKNGTNSGDDYAYYADGKLQKDLNRNVSLIEYNYLDLVSKVKFANNDSIQYFYSSTGEKRRTERVIGGQKSYTLYDGEIIYTFTGVNTSLNDFKVSEIQNPEGRFVNGKLEYGYTDHLGNLRLSYKDSLGTAFVTQGYAYDAWGLELKTLRYQFSGTSPVRYTWQGKEDLEADNLEGWSDFGWRIEDRTLGRWFTPDPEDQFESVSTYALCINNPVTHIDPDGRILPILIPIIAGVVGGGLNLASNWSKVKGDPLAALGYFATGAVGGVVSLTNPLAGGAITSGGNAAIDIATGNIPSFKNAEDALLYIGKEAAFGAATSFAGAQAGKIIGPALSKLGNSVGGWFKHGFQTYAQESIETVIINGKPITTTIEVGIKATKTYVPKALGGTLGNVAKGGVQYTKSNLKLGQEMHKVYKADIADGITTFKEFTKVPGIRPDFVDFNTKTIYELKPFNPRQIRQGLKQLDNYKLLFEQKYGGTWKTILEHY